MLRNLFVENYALINNLEIDFQYGLTVITGETGAGKSILLGALALALGQRADLSTLKDKEKKCIIEATFNIEKYHLKYFFDEEDLDYDDITIIRREITPKGKSRAFINDTPVNLNQLKTLGERLIDIHSQHQNLQLNEQEFQVDFIDNLSDSIKLRKEYQDAYKRFLTLSQQVADLKEKNQQQKERSDFVEFQYRELEAANLKDGEQEDLEKTQNLLSNSEEIAENLNSILQRFQRDEFGIITELGLAQHELQKIAGYFDNGDELISRVSSAAVDLDDLAQELQQKTEAVQFDPTELERINQRLNHIYSLQQKHHKSSIIDLINLQDEYEQELNELESYEEDLQNLQNSLEVEKNKMENLATKLHKARNEKAKQISGQITHQLIDLGMPRAVFLIEVSPSEKFNRYGRSNIDFKFTTDEKMEPRDVTKVASGGELSRIMLIVKSMLASQKALPSLIFDEIDSGVSGAIAYKMGNIMKHMAHNMQIISITHLPQIAARGQNHYVVYKTHANEGTSTQIKAINSEERIEVLAQMLSSGETSPAAIANAKELLSN